MIVLEWILVLVLLSEVVLGLVFLLGIIPKKWRGPVETNRNGTFIMRFAGIALIVYGLEGLLNIWASLVGLAWLDTNGVIGISVVTLFLLTISMAYFSGMVLTTGDAAPSRHWQLLMGTTSMVFAIGFFMTAMGHKVSIEWMESVGRYFELAVIPLFLFAIATRKQRELPGSSHNE